MTSVGPYSQSNNFQYMFDQPDLRGCLPKKGECPNSLMRLINNHTDFRKFKYIVNLAKLDGILNDPQADFTLFVPSDDAIQGLGEGVFVNMDDATARHIVKSSMLDRKIPRELLQDSPASYFKTKDPPNRLFITNISGRTCIQNDINIIHFDMQAANGIIHVVDKLIWPEII
jgi:uncharacterized surface protein with fasciclin (FAS1) repeats